MSAVKAWEERTTARSMPCSATNCRTLPAGNVVSSRAARLRRFHPTDPAARPPPGDPPDRVRAGAGGPAARRSHAPARAADARSGASFHPERMTPRRPGSGTVALIRAHVRDVPPEEHR